MANIPSGELRRTVSFDMGKETHRTLYEFSRSLNLSEFVRQALATEMARREGRATVSIRMGDEARK